MNFQLIIAFLTSLTNLGGKLGEQLGSKVGVIMEAINAGRALIQQVHVGAEQLKALTAEIDAMVAADVPPSDEQLNALKARFTAAYDVAAQYLADHPDG